MSGLCSSMNNGNATMYLNSSLIQMCKMCCQWCCCRDFIVKISPREITNCVPGTVCFVFLSFLLLFIFTFEKCRDLKLKQFIYIYIVLMVSKSLFCLVGQRGKELSCVL